MSQKTAMIEEYLNWRVNMEDEDFIHAFGAIKTLEQVKVEIAKPGEPKEKLARIEEEAAKWL